jgi:DNA-binding XRE family transcriptional regulator
MADDEDLTGPTVFRRQLGRELRTLREAAGYTIELAAKKMEISRSKYGRLEHGMVSVRSLDVAQMCQLFSAPSGLTDALVDLAKKTKEKGWWHSFSTVMPETFEMYVGLETAASEIHEYQSELVPGLFQTEAYARALFQHEHPDMEEATIDRRVALRMKRQRILRRADADATAVTLTLNESVLRRPISDTGIMADQLLHLNELGELPNVTVRVIPFSAGLNAGVLSGPFVVLRFPDATEPPTVYMDGYTGDLYLEKRAEVARYDAAFRDIVERSMDDKASRDLIVRTAKEYLS